MGCDTAGWFGNGGLGRLFGALTVAVAMGIVGGGTPSVGQVPELVVAFDGGEGRVVIPHAAALNPAGQDWACEFWVLWPQDFEIDHVRFLSKWDADRNGGGFSVGSELALMCSDRRRQNVNIRRHIPRGQWVHITAQIDSGEGQLRVFVDGERVTQTAWRLTGSIDPSADLIIGTAAASQFQKNHFAIRDVRIWKDVVFTPEQIQENMNRRLRGNEPGLAGYWPMDESRGEVVRDLAGDNAGRLVNDPQWALVLPFEADLSPAVAPLGQAATLGPVELRNPRGQVSYQWYFNEEPIAGATASSLTLQQVEEAHLGRYHVEVDDEREVTPVISRSVELAEPDWPTWQYDAARSAKSPHQLAEELHLQWVRELPAPQGAWGHQWDHQGKLDFDVSYAPVVQGQKVFVPSSVTDSVTAYSLLDGSEQWRFFADGPVRLAPAVWGGRVYFTADDGHLYCVDADTGALQWKFRGGPTDHRLLGNERIINFWAARGAPLVLDGVVYFTAGFWPLHGVFIHAIDAETGQVVWVNDTTSSDYVPLPHSGASGYGGLAPQGYIAANGDFLVVAGGRGPAGYVDRRTGELVHLNPREGGKGDGGYAVHSTGWGIRRNATIEQRVRALADQIEGEVFSALGARDRLLVVTKAGRIYCFGPEPAQAVRHAHLPVPLRPRTGDWSEPAQMLLETLGETAGYALMLGMGSGDLLREVLNRSELHVVVVEADARRVRQLREELVEADLYGRRAAVIEAPPATFSVQPYLFSMVLSEDAQAAGLAAEQGVLRPVLDRLRPYGGVAYLGAASPQALSELFDAASEAEVDQVALARGSGHLFARRGGPLTGADQWTHQYYGPGNTMLSKDERVRLPLGLLWFGGPSNHNVLPRHSGGPRPQIAGGRQVFLGVENVSARCVYTGRALWDREFPEIGHPFTNMSLEQRWQSGAHVYMTNIPGATYIGSPLVTLPDAIYIRYRGEIHRLDPVTGRTVAKFSLPGRPVSEIYGDDKANWDWGHISIQGDYLITTAEPHLFEDQVPGWLGSYSATSSRRLVVMDRHDGTVRWEREARIGFRHNAIVSSSDPQGRLFVIDGLSENAVEHLSRRGQRPEEESVVIALDLNSGREIWTDNSNVYGTFLLYSGEHDILIEGGSQDLRRTLEDEPRDMTARQGRDGRVLWERGGRFTLPGAVRGEMLIPGRPGIARSLLTGEDWMRHQPHTGESTGWSFRRAYGCNTLNASQHLLLYRSGYAAFFDLEHDTGTGTFSGFRSGCTANLIAAEGIMNALDYTRTCTCNYANQTSLALIHMPGDSNIEVWTRYDGSAPDPSRHGINFGAAGRRVDDTGRVWHHEDGALRRHASYVQSPRPGGIDWVAASARQVNGNDPIRISDLLVGPYTVRLHFAELVEAVEPGQRVFAVFVNGQEVLNGFDIVARAGGSRTALVEEFTVDVDRSLTIELRQSDQSELEPLISGIELTLKRE